ncbi:MAG: response regulator [Pseudomonadota bacterium]|nr:response regulator [Pseudomonadota bacterium]
MLPEHAPVLLVDDSPDDRCLFCMCWAQAKILNPIVELGHGQAAIDYLSAASGPDAPALVFLDLKMPVRNGFEVLDWLHAHPVFKRLPVIVLTASEHAGDVEQAYDRGANSFLVKPSSVEELLALLLAVKDYWLRFNVFPRR